LGPTPPVVAFDLPVPGDPGEPRGWEEPAGDAVRSLEPQGDIHATADYRLHLARVLSARALAQAWSASGAGGEGRAA
jgi:carbon-monoxide dehydrogenase medium subunit